MLDTLNNPLLTLAALVAFIMLAIASEPYGHGYTEQERADMHRLIESLQYDDTPESKIVYLYGEE